MTPFINEFSIYHETNAFYYVTHEHQVKGNVTYKVTTSYDGRQFIIHMLSLKGPDIVKLRLSFGCFSHNFIHKMLHRTPSCNHGIVCHL